MPDNNNNNNQRGGGAGGGEDDPSREDTCEEEEEEENEKEPPPSQQPPSSQPPSRTTCWQLLKNCTLPDGERYGHAAVALSSSAANTVVVVAGGYRQAIRNTCRTVWLWNATTTPNNNNTWRRGPCLQEPRRELALVTCGNQLYAIGGRNEEQQEQERGCFLDTLECLENVSKFMTPSWDDDDDERKNDKKGQSSNDDDSQQQPQQPHWTTLSCRLASPTGGCAAVAIRNRYLVILGGYKSSLVQVLDTRTNSWVSTGTTTNNMTSCRYGLGAIVVEDKEHSNNLAVYALGGSANKKKDDNGKLNTVECWTVTQNDLATWSSSSSLDTKSASPPQWHVQDHFALQTGRRAFGLVQFNDNNKIVVVMGGWDGTHKLGSVELLDFCMGQQQRLPDLNCARFGCAAVLLPSSLSSSCGTTIAVLGGVGLDSIETLDLTAVLKEQDFATANKPPPQLPDKVVFASREELEAEIARHQALVDGARSSTCLEVVQQAAQAEVHLKQHLVPLRQQFQSVAELTHALHIEKAKLLPQNQSLSERLPILETIQALEEQLQQKQSKRCRSEDDAKDEMTVGATTTNVAAVTRASSQQGTTKDLATTSTTTNVVVKKKEDSPQPVKTEEKSSQSHNVKVEPSVPRSTSAAIMSEDQQHPQPDATASDIVDNSHSDASPRARVVVRAQQVFLSHTGQDANAAVFTGFLSEFLSDKYGIQAFLDSHSLETGVTWKQEIEANAKHCQVFVCILSESYFCRFWCLYELDLALSTNRTIVPVYLDHQGEIPKPDDAQVRQQFREILERKQAGKSVDDIELQLDRWCQNLVQLDAIQGIRNYSTHKHSVSTFCAQVAQIVQDKCVRCGASLSSSSQAAASYAAAASPPPKRQRQHASSSPSSRLSLAWHDRIRAEQKVRSLYNLQAEMSPNDDASMFFPTLEDHFAACTTQQLQQWTTTHEPTIQRAVKSYRDRSLAGVRDIRGFFSSSSSSSSSLPSSSPPTPKASPAPAKAASSASSSSRRHSSQRTNLKSPPNKRSSSTKRNSNRAPTTSSLRQSLLKFPIIVVSSSSTKSTTKASAKKREHSP